MVEEREMDIYQLEYILHEPSEDHGGMYWAEIPALQGCTAWGDTVEDTMNDLWGNAKIFIELTKEDGKPLPPALVQDRETNGTMTVSA